MNLGAVVAAYLALEGWPETTKRPRPLPRSAKVALAWIFGLGAVGLAFAITLIVIGLRTGR